MVKYRTPIYTFQNFELVAGRFNDYIKYIIVWKAFAFVLLSWKIHCYFSQYLLNFYHS